MLLIFSLIFSAFFFLFGDILDQFLNEFFHPLLLFGTLAIISGAGIVLTTYTQLSGSIVLLVSILLGVIAYVLFYYFLIIPISRAESSNSHSALEYQGRIGEVITTIPEEGYGEVLIKSVSGSRNETARSFDETMIPQGTKVVVVEVEKDCIAVSKFEED